MVFEIRTGFQIRGEDADSSVPDGFRLHMAHAPFASISSNFMRSLGTVGESPNSRKEKHTAIEFPTEMCHHAKPCPSLAGLGVRAKRLFGIKDINIYALGIYLDPAAAKKTLAPHYQEASEEALSKDQKMFDDIVAAKAYEKSLRLVISFGSLKRAQFVDALQDRLEPRLKEAGELSTLDHFKKQFDDVAFKKGTEIVFVQEGDKLVTKVDGQQKGSITSSPLCRSLFDIYLGTDPVAPEAKTTFGKSVAALLKE